MDGDFSPTPEATSSETADSMLEALRAHPEWSERERDFHLGRIVERFPIEVLMEAVVQRLGDLSGGDADSLLRLVEINVNPTYLNSLADALELQPTLAADRSWEALSLLEEHGVLEFYPSLRQRWDDLNETLDDEGSIDELIEQIEGDPDGLWMALQGLNAVEPEIRPRIIESLVERPIGPGMAEFLRLLAYASDASTQTAALDALAAAPAVDAVWRDLATHHADPEVVALASRKLDLARQHREPARELVVIDSPTIEASAISSIDGDGMAVIVIQSSTGSRRAVASFLCQIEEGVLEVAGELDEGQSASALGFESMVDEIGRETILDADALALNLLAGALLMNSEKSPPSLRFWLETTVGRELRPRPFHASFPDWDPALGEFGDTAESVEAILNACPDWVDASPLTHQIAEEIMLREGNTTPDPKRDAGAFRFLFEHQLKNELESYRRRLLWMAWFWRESGRVELGRRALGLAWEISDPQNVVPGHPFPTAIAKRSLTLAQSRMRRV